MVYIRNGDCEVGQTQGSSNQMQYEYGYIDSFYYLVYIFIIRVAHYAQRMTDTRFIGLTVRR